MNVVHLIFSLGVGGAENLLVDIVNQQVQHARVDVIVVNRVYSPALIRRIDPRVRVTCLDREVGNKWNVLPILRCWQLLVSLRPTVLHCHNDDMMKLVRPWKNRTVLTVHNVAEPTTYLRLYRQIFAISKAVEEDLTQRGNPGSVVVLNGIDFTAFAPKTTYDGYQDEFRLLQISRLLHTEKGQDVAIRALAALVRDPRYAHVTLSLVGEGPSLVFLQELAQELGVASQVHFLGVQDRGWIMQHLHTFDVLLQPSYSEGFGLTVLEGIAAGLPTVASNLEGPAEIMQGLPTGFLFTPGNPEHLADRLREVFALYREGQLATPIARSYELAEQRFSIKSTAESYLRLYPRSR
ncbi:hypothetical protein GCM10022409_11580 [Hymenobacter glaciei]|uniref:Glycosyltransferase n=1 Tax=Hymenobacter glaciei TaxID=877209 RepID=A0ABP7TP03_9BACT